MTKGAWLKRRLRWVLLCAALLVAVIAGVSAYAIRWRYRFYHHVTREELSHEVKHSTFLAPIRTSGPPLHLQLYQQENALNQPLVLFTSGDGGWSPFCADIAAHIAATGVTVVGIDVKEYLMNFASPKKPVAIDDLARDYDAIARLSLTQRGIDSKSTLTLAGWSLGAGYSVIAASQTEFDVPISKVLVISLPQFGELAWRSTDALIYLTHGRPNEKGFDVQPFLKQLTQTPIVFVTATNDDDAPFREAQLLFQAAPGAKHFYAVKANGHHFEGGEKEFYQDLDLGLSQPQIAEKGDKKLKEIGSAAN